MSRTIHLNARPVPHSFDTATTAVIVVDMQNDFGAPGGMFDRAGIDIKPIQEIVEPIRAVLQAARSEGMLVVYLKMAFPEAALRVPRISTPATRRSERLPRMAVARFGGER